MNTHPAKREAAIADSHRLAQEQTTAEGSMGRDRLVDQIARAMARAENASEDHFEAYRHVAEAVAAVVEPLLAEKDKAAVEVVERLLRATMDNPDAGDLHLARHKAREFLAGGAASEVGSTGFVPSEGADQLASPGSVEEQEPGPGPSGRTRELMLSTQRDQREKAQRSEATVRLCALVKEAGPVVTDEERAALRSACSKCGGLVRLELRCEACGDMPAGSLTENEGELDQLERQAFDRGFAEGVIHTQGVVPENQAEFSRLLRKMLNDRFESGWELGRSMLLFEQKDAARPVRVEEQGEEG